MTALYNFVKSARGLERIEQRLAALWRNETTPALELNDVLTAAYADAYQRHDAVKLRELLMTSLEDAARDPVLKARVDRSVRELLAVNDADLNSTLSLQARPDCRHLMCAIRGTGSAEKSVPKIHFETKPESQARFIGEARRSDPDGFSAAAERAVRGDAGLLGDNAGRCVGKASNPAGPNPALRTLARILERAETVHPGLAANARDSEIAGSAIEAVRELGTRDECQALAALERLTTADCQILGPRYVHGLSLLRAGGLAGCAR